MLNDISSLSNSSLLETNTPSNLPSTCTNNGILRPFNSSLSIKFAPLPEVPQRKRRSNAQLGVANRANLMRRQQLRRDGKTWEEEEPYHHHNTRTYVNTDGSSVTVRYESVRSPGAEDEDPFLIFGRMVKDATQNLWKRVSSGGSPGSAAGEKKSLSSSPRHIVVAIPQEDRDKESVEGVWDDESPEITHSSLQNGDLSIQEIQDTEAIADEQSKYSWMALPQLAINHLSASLNSSQLDNLSSPLDPETEEIGIDQSTPQQHTVQQSSPWTPYHSPPPSVVSLTSDTSSSSTPLPHTVAP